MYRYTRKDHLVKKSDQYRIKAGNIQHHEHQ